MRKSYFVAIFIFTHLYAFSQDIDRLILNNDFNQALQLIDSQLVKNDAQPLLYLKKGMIMQRKYDFSNAVKCLEKAYTLDSSNVKILNELAEVNSSLGDYRRALPYCQTIFDRDTTNLVLAIGLVNCYFKLRTYREPYKILYSAYQRDSNNLFVNKQLAFAAMRTGHDSLAIALYNKVIDQNPSDLGNYTNLASVYQKKENYIRVVETLEKGIAAFPEETSLLIRLGDTHFAKRKYDNAAENYEKYLAKGDSVYDVLKNLGLCYYYQKHTKEGLELLENCLAMKPNDPVTALFIGLCYKDLKQYEESIAYLNFASRNALPYYLSDLYSQLGNVYTEERNFKQAVRSLKKAYSLDSTKYEILFKIANTYDVWQKDKSQAIRYYNSYLKSPKEENEMHHQLMEYVVERKKKLAR
jgi:tetratricopeptide (TPR) repeat protein